MNIAKICFNDTVNGNGFRTSIFISGCSKYPKCKNCWNKDLWNYNLGQKYTEEIKNQILDSLNKSYIKGLSILGGEFTDNLKDGQLLDLVKSVKELYPNKTIYAWTGYTFEELIKDKLKLEILQYIDMLRDGEYIEELKDLQQYLQGSKNQRYIDVKSSLEGGEIVEYEFGK